MVWSLRISDARAGIERASQRLAKIEIDGDTYYMSKRRRIPRSDENRVHLLPAFDEYIISYSNRSAVLGNAATQRVLRSGRMNFVHSNGVFLPTIVADGQVVGTWKRRNGKEEVILEMRPFLKLNKEQMAGVNEAAERYEDFLEMPVVLK